MGIKFLKISAKSSSACNRKLNAIFNQKEKQTRQKFAYLFPLLYIAVLKPVWEGRRWGRPKENIKLQWKIKSCVL